MIILPFLPWLGFDSSGPTFWIQQCSFGPLLAVMMTRALELDKKKKASKSIKFIFKVPKDFSLFQWLIYSGEKFDIASIYDFEIMNLVIIYWQYRWSFDHVNIKKFTTIYNI